LLLTAQQKNLKWCDLVTKGNTMTATTLEKPARTSTVSVKLDIHYKDRLSKLASAQKRTPHYLMKEAIQCYIDEAEIAQNFIRAGEESLADYEATGLHISHEEYKTWRASLATSNPLPLPVCHT
jgi:predicted transcriptional regulator